MVIKINGISLLQGTFLFPKNYNQISSLLVLQIKDSAMVPKRICRPIDLFLKGKHIYLLKINCNKFITR